jgi:hypothetical protein
MTKATNDESSFKSKSHVCRLEQKLNANLDHQQSKFTKLHQIILDLSNQVHRLKSANNSRTHSPISNFRTNSSHNYVNNDYTGEHFTADSLLSPACLLESNHMVTSQLNQLNSYDYFDSSNSIEHFRHIQDVLSKTTVALEPETVTGQGRAKFFALLTFLLKIVIHRDFQANNADIMINYKRCRYQLITISLVTECDNF